MHDPQITLQSKLRDEFLWRDVALKKLAYEAADEIDRLRGILHEIFDELQDDCTKWIIIRDKFKVAR